MNKMQKISILSISLLVIMSSAAISPVLPEIGEYFSNSSELMIKMVISLPYIFIIPVALITGRLIFYIKKKHLLCIGLSLYIIGGLGGGLQNSIYALLVFRAIMGIGMGVLIPLTRGIIADFFTGNERVKMIGYSSAFNNFGGIIAYISAGLLTVYGWRYPFLVYILAFVVLFLVVIYLPEQDIPPKETHKTHINRNIWMLGIGLYMMILIFFAIPSGLAYFVSSNNFGGGATTGILIAIVTLCAFFVGIIFHRIRSLLKGGTVIFGLSLLTLGMFWIGISTNLVEVALALVLVGFGMGIVSPAIYLQTSLDSSKSDVTLSLAIVSIFSYLGRFSSPLINSFLQQIFNYHSVKSTFIISTYIGLFTIAIVIINKAVKIYIPSK